MQNLRITGHDISFIWFYQEIEDADDLTVVFIGSGWIISEQTFTGNKSAGLLIIDVSPVILDMVKSENRQQQGKLVFRIKSHTRSKSSTDAFSDFQIPVLRVTYDVNLQNR